MLERWMDAAQAQALKRWATGERKPDDSTEKRAVKPLLVVDDTRPGEIELDGRTLPLQDKQYRLIRILAMHPGQCVPYDATLYRDVWGDIVVEDNQMHYQKRMLIKRLAEAGPAWETLITTVPKRGFTLNLTPEQVCLRVVASCAA
jgi:DNA-binding winged helix-turn-helix (wHTH) protein